MNSLYTFFFFMSNAHPDKDKFAVNYGHSEQCGSDLQRCCSLQRGLILPTHIFLSPPGKEIFPPILVLKLVPYPSRLSLRLPFTRRLSESAFSRRPSIPPAAQLGFIVLPCCVPSVADCIDIISLLCVCFIVSCMPALRLQEGEELGSHHQELSISTLSTVWHKLSVCRNTRVNKSCFERLLKLIN